MRQQYSRLVVLAGMTALLGAPQAGALEKCAAKINSKDGTILVAAKSVSGTLTWGWTATTQIQPFFNAGTCQSGGTASKCTQGSPGTLLAITPPPDCTLQLKDGAATCTAFLKKCTPGKRPLVTFPTRFIDNGDGTVSDTSTGLMWEKTTDDSTIHDKDNFYTWSTGSPYNPDGTAFFTFLATLNGPTPFAGYGDWRLPTLTELKTIVDLTAPGCGSGSPCIDQTVFGPTQASFYWSATTFAGFPISARLVDFFNGTVFNLNKTGNSYVRAVRSGS
jgi:hypothetical protein